MVKRLVFTSEEVRNGLAGKKHSKRVIINPQPTFCQMTKSGLLVSDSPIEVKDGLVLTSNGELIKPPYNVDDIVYIGEQWCNIYKADEYQYRADYGDHSIVPSGVKYNVVEYSANMIKWNPAITLPRKAARLWYIVIDVTVQRLQDIKDEQAKSEGANYIRGKSVSVLEKLKRSPVDRYHANWDEQHKNRLDSQGWAANPWVYVLDLVAIHPENIAGMR